MLPNFETHYPPSNIRSVPLQAAEQYQGTLPAEILYLWQTYGWGKYGSGLIELVNPQDYSDNLRQWLGSEKPHYTPFAITAFGELFYHRKLSAEGDEDICLLDIQYSSCKVLDWNTRDFLKTRCVMQNFAKPFCVKGFSSKPCNSRAACTTAKPSCSSPFWRSAAWIMKTTNSNVWAKAVRPCTKPLFSNLLRKTENAKR